jgi:hypothetical protein
VAEYPIGWPALKSQKQNIHTEIMRHSKFPKFCVGIVDIQESVFSKFQAFLYSFTPVIDKMVLGDRVPDYVQYIPTGMVHATMYAYLHIECIGML